MFKTNCARCYNPPMSLSPRIAGSVVMRTCESSACQDEDEDLLLKTSPGAVTLPSASFENHNRKLVCPRDENEKNTDALNGPCTLSSCSSRFCVLRTRTIAHDRSSRTAIRF